MTSYAKAILACVIAGLGVLVTALDDGGITAQEWVETGLAAAVALGAVWGVPNTTRSPQVAERQSVRLKR